MNGNNAPLYLWIVPSSLLQALSIIWTMSHPGWRYKGNFQRWITLRTDPHLGMAATTHCNHAVIMRFLHMSSLFYPGYADGLPLLIQAYLFNSLLARRHKSASLSFADSSRKHILGRSTFWPDYVLIHLVGGWKEGIRKVPVTWFGSYFSWLEGFI